MGGGRGLERGERRGGRRVRGGGWREGGKGVREERRVREGRGRVI